MGLEGADVDFLGGALKTTGIWLLAAAGALILVVLADIIISDLIRSKNISHGGVLRFLSRAAVITVCAVIAAPGMMYMDRALKISQFIQSRYVYSDLYENNYVDPETVTITSDGQKRNVIILYLESMETAYSSFEKGGALPTSVIPRLTQLADENISFGDKKGNSLRGIHNPTGTTWTTGALLASSAGVPFAFQIGKNQMGKDGTFAPDMNMLGDFLRNEGYNQEFLCGSDSYFGGRRQLYETHGDYEIYDYQTAVDRKAIPEDYYVWWGFEDHRLYDIAKEELLKLSEDDKPFNFTMLTVDTHHVGGYRCKWCPTKYKRETANIIACADRQAYDFIRWCQEQEFYQNTTIVVLGDHPRMDNLLVKRASRFDRCSYDCFINSAKNGAAGQNRLAVTMDLFPTILSSMGYTIEGDRLGLGTDLFSATPTLAEEMTYDKLNDELAKNSHYYQDKFGK